MEGHTGNGMEEQRLSLSHNLKHWSLCLALALAQACKMGVFLLSQKADSHCCSESKGEETEGD